MTRSLVHGSPTQEAYERALKLEPEDAALRKGLEKVGTGPVGAGLICAMLDDHTCLSPMCLLRLSDKRVQCGFADWMNAAVVHVLRSVVPHNQFASSQPICIQSQPICVQPFVHSFLHTRFVQ